MPDYSCSYPGNCPTDHGSGEIRCRRCRRLLMKGVVVRVEVKCPKCGYLQRFETERSSDDK